MPEQKGVKEIEELLDGVDAIVMALVSELKDGFQVSDLAAILAKVAIDPKVKDAFDGVGGVVGEFKDISINEGIELGIKGARMVAGWIGAIVKK
jgi:hypothetical protein